MTVEGRRGNRRRGFRKAVVVGIVRCMLLQQWFGIQYATVVKWRSGNNVLTGTWGKGEVKYKAEMRTVMRAMF